KAWHGYSDFEYDRRRSEAVRRASAKASDDLKFFPVESDDLVGAVGEEEEIGDPGRHAIGLHHGFDLLAKFVPETVAEKHERHAGADIELEVAKFDARLLQRADAADVENAEVGDFEPFL